ncbi:hypothetical protein J6590_065781 [Homalodisca vitripennis]|nr:hypothetical protein J6590_065781 [Homalodisca vitripennis]
MALMTEKQVTAIVQKQSDIAPLIKWTKDRKPSKKRDLPDTMKVNCKNYYSYISVDEEEVENILVDAEDETSTTNNQSKKTMRRHKSKKHGYSVEVLTAMRKAKLSRQVLILSDSHGSDILRERLHPTFNAMYLIKPNDKLCDVTKDVMNLTDDFNEDIFASNIKGQDGAQ